MILLELSGRITSRRIRRSEEVALLSVRAAACRSPARWDHLEVSSASSMGPPFRR